MQSPVTPSDYYHLISGYRLTQSALLGGPVLLYYNYLNAAEIDYRLILGYRLTQTALLGGPVLLYLDCLITAEIDYRLIGDPVLLYYNYFNVAEIDYRLISGYRLTQTALLGGAYCCTIITLLRRR